MILPFLIFAQISGVEFTSSVTPRTVYVGQQVTYEGSMRVSEYASKLFRDQPDYTPPEARGTTTYDLPFIPSSIRTTYAAGLEFQTFPYRRAFFPIAEGLCEIGPASVVLVMGDLHDPYIHKQDTLRAPPQKFTVLPLPVEGRPADFTGAVGQFSIRVHADAKTVNTGESFTLTAVVQGEGNLELLPRPPLTIPWATITKGPEQWSWDSTGTTIHGSKTFQWTIVPNDNPTGLIPPLRYSYFNPTTKRYATAAAEPLSLSVGTAVNADASQSAADAIAAQDPGAATSPFPFLLRSARTHAIAVTGAGVAVAALILFMILRRRRPDDEDLA